jgi:O-antigen/teichoic acid export membrane protein
MKLKLPKTDIQKLYRGILDSTSEIKHRGFQSMLLFISWVGAMGINFLGSILTTRILGPASYGDYKFVQTIWALLTLLISFGFLQSGARVVLLETNPSSAKQATGVVLIIALIMGIFMGAITDIIAFPIDYFFHTNLALITIILSPLVIGFTLSDALELILQSTNKINLYAALAIVPSILYVVCIYTISRITVINAGITLAIQAGSYLAGVLLIIIFLHPSIGSFRYYFPKIIGLNKKFGFQIYLGTIATLATSYINRLSISYWVGNTSMGFFSLASTITDPLKFIPNAAAVSSYQSFSKQEKISKNVFWFTIILSSSALIAALLLIGPLLAWVYPKSFSSVGPIARLLIFGAVAQGLGEFYNHFLQAHGKGEALRNVAYLVGGVNVLGIIFLTPFLGVNGVVLTTILAGVANVTFMLITYRRYIHGTAK